MMNLQKNHIEAIMRAGLLNDNNIHDDDIVYDSAFDAWVNDSPEVRAWNAEQDKGAYSVVIRGVPGAYFIQALEYDDLGPFETISQAEAEVSAQYGEFIVVDE
jgi:hypothetical protein